MMGAYPSELARGVARVRIAIVNAYLVGEPGESWILVDTGLPGSADLIRAAAAARYGAGARPEAILLTHGHFDHAGSAHELAVGWDVPIYAHALEFPYVTGVSDYPPQDPTIGGALGFLSRFFPHSGRDLTRWLRPLPDDGGIPNAAGWRHIHTPGHTPGHVSLFRESDRVLLAADALATVNQDSALATATERQELHGPPAPFTPDFESARRSLARLAELAPAAIGAGHGAPIVNQSVGADLRRFAATYAPPVGGRYTSQSALTDDQGVVEVPPAVPDPLPRRAAAAALLALTCAALFRGPDRS